MPSLLYIDIEAQWKILSDQMKNEVTKVLRYAQDPSKAKTATLYHFNYACVNRLRPDVPDRQALEHEGHLVQVGVDGCASPQARDMDGLEHSVR